jgi:hypothetical protein
MKHNKNRELEWPQSVSPPPCWPLPDYQICPKWPLREKSMVMLGNFGE